MSWWAWLILFVAVFSLLPVVESSGYVRRVAFDTVLYMLLALGLNIVVGWGGLLDLGYVALYGVGAYTYAFLASNQFGLHLPTLVAVPATVLIGALVGLLLGLPSRRLTGDYLAIVTLFFLQLFQTLTTNADNVFGHNLTGGPNGILDVDPFNLFGHELIVQHQGVFAVSYFYVALAVFTVVYVALRLVNHSRTGRAWRSLREDPLAAEAMGMPVNWLKLMSFSFGAGVAALTGTVFAALNASVFPLTFYFVLLIIVYTMVILGGSGSQAGVVLGALIIGPLLELLRDPGKARVLFYLALVGGVVFAFRRSRTLGVVVAATVVLGFVVHAIARRVRPRVGRRRARRRLRRRGRALGRRAGAPGVVGAADDVHRPDRPGAPAHPPARPAATGAARADALPRGVRLGERDAREPRADAVHRARPDPDLADDPASERPARRAPRGDRLVAGASCSSCRASRSRSAACRSSPSSTCTSTGARSSA